MIDFLRMLFLPLAALLPTAVIVAGLPARGQERPNIVVIVADDLGHADLAYRSSPIKTPHRDALAMGGVRLPAFVNWPGRLKPALVKEPLHHVHVMPTLLALVGGRGQADKHPDVVRDLEARLAAYARQAKMSEWLESQVHSLGAQGETAFDPGSSIDGGVPHEKPALPGSH